MVELLVLIVTGVGVGLALTLVFWGVLALVRPILDAVRGVLHPVAPPAEDKMCVLSPADLDHQMEKLPESFVVDLPGDISSTVQPDEEEAWSQVLGISSAQHVIPSGLLQQDWGRLRYQGMRPNVFILGSSGIGKTRLLTLQLEKSLEELPQNAYARILIPQILKLSRL